MDVFGDTMSRVTIADVAVAAGVSKTAVSFAFNNPEKLGSATVERVLQVARGLTLATEVGGGARVERHQQRLRAVGLRDSTPSE